MSPNSSVPQAGSFVSQVSMWDCLSRCLIVSLLGVTMSCKLSLMQSASNCPVGPDGKYRRDPAISNPRCELTAQGGSFEGSAASGTAGLVIYGRNVLRT